MMPGLRHPFLYGSDDAVERPVDLSLLPLPDEGEKDGYAVGDARQPALLSVHALPKGACDALPQAVDMAPYTNQIVY